MILGEYKSARGTVQIWGYLILSLLSFLAKEMPCKYATTNIIEGISTPPTPPEARVNPPGTWAQLEEARLRTSASIGDLCSSAQKPCLALRRAWGTYARKISQPNAPSLKSYFQNPNPQPLGPKSQTKKDFLHISGQGTTNSPACKVSAASHLAASHALLPSP